MHHLLSVCLVWYMQTDACMEREDALPLPSLHDLFVVLPE